ncbi:glycoside hydrolase family 16 protein [Changchengzhania lutea]|uniref:glycoside hydrolase family 16 protein n=1 Tax=Changchengzhania lutea TaxID=2049305 RepID=UPI00115E4FE7|nr:glycoside hydrolase family 16 protein [Changchengzhania lutea]
MKTSLKILIVLLGAISFSCSSSDISTSTPLVNSTCTDGIQNGTETGIDCGGDLCDSCPPTCNDGIKNGTETDVDCGGDSCAPCPDPLVSIPTTGYDAPTFYVGYNLIWSDEFDQEILLTDKWGFHLENGCPSLCGWGNGELQYYTKKNHTFQDGNLIISTKNESSNGFDYFSSARIHTDDKFEFKYGRIDIRAAMPSAVGTWVALWLLNKDYSILYPDAEWPSGGEIDIMEYVGHKKNEILATAHFGNDIASHQFISTFLKAPANDFDKTFHVFSLVWEENKITWLLNNIPYKTFSTANTTNSKLPYPFNDEFYLVINTSVGGNLGTIPLVSEYPTFLIVDYIRIYQQ